MKLRILHKGLAFLALPLILQVVCISQLYHLLQKADEVTANQTRLVRMLNLTSQVMAEFGIGLAPAIKAVFSAHDVSDIPDISAEDYMNKMNKLIGDAMPLVRTQEERDVFLAARPIMMDEYNLMKRLEKVRGLPYTALLPTFMGLKSRFEGASGKIKDLANKMEYQRMRLEAEIAQEEATRAKLKSQILILVIVEIALTVLLMALFLRDITKRLGMLVENARMIPKHGALTQKVPGSDELAYLDTVLHQASRELQAAAEYRSSLMQMVAHDLRSPLGSAQLAIETVTTPDTNVTEQQRIDRAMGIKRILNRLMAFVEDLLTVDKLEAGKLELAYDAVDTKRLIDETIEAVATAAKERQITISNDVAPVVIAADPHRLLQVCTNLISNAIKYSKEGATVRISSEQSADRVKIKVQDQGQGIPKDEQSGLFQKYYQTKKTQSGGFGLGLAISKLIIDEHNGEIGVESEPGAGSTFWFSLPIVSDGNSEAD